MISTLKTTALLCACLFAWASPCRADAVMTFAVENNLDLTKLTVGQSVTVDVVVSGLVPGSQIQYIAVFYSTTNPLAIGNHIDVSTGSALAPLGAVIGYEHGTTLESGFGGSYTPPPGTHVADGALVRYSFRAAAVGSGVLNFGPIAAAIVEPFVEPEGIAYIAENYTENLPELPFTIGPAVPEPSSLVMLGLGAMGTAAYGLRRRKIAA